MADCFYIKIGPEEKEEWDCTSEEDLEMAYTLKPVGDTYVITAIAVTADN